MPNNIYLLFHCDQWKTKDSMRLVTATTNSTKFKAVLSGEVRRKNMDFNQKSNIDLPIAEMNNHLDYGMIEIVRDGERQ